MNALLDVRRIAFGYRPGHPVFTDLSFALERGELFTILGPNGAGKSTLLNCVTAVRPAQSGHILLGGADVAGLPPRTRARRVAYVPQTSSVSYAYTVLDYVLMDGPRTSTCCSNRPPATGRGPSRPWTCSASPSWPGGRAPR